MGAGCEHAAQCGFLQTNKDSKDCKTQYMIQHYCNNSANSPQCCHQVYLAGRQKDTLPWFIAPNGENVVRRATA